AGPRLPRKGTVALGVAVGRFRPGPLAIAAVRAGFGNKIVLRKFAPPPPRRRPPGRTGPGGGKDGIQGRDQVHRPNIGLFFHMSRLFSEDSLAGIRTHAEAPGPPPVRAEARTTSPVGGGDGKAFGARCLWAHLPRRGRSKMRSIFGWGRSPL